MAFEKMKTEIGAILDEIARRPGDRRVLEAALREKIAEIEAVGFQVPEAYREMRDKGAEDTEDLFDNLPV